MKTHGYHENYMEIPLMRNDPPTSYQHMTLAFLHVVISLQSQWYQPCFADEAAEAQRV